MLVNKVYKTLTILCVLALFPYCKTKQESIQMVSEPDRSDYIITASYIYVTACDSASKQLSRIILDTSQFIIPHSKEVKKRLEHLLAGNRNLEYHSMQNSIRYIMHQSVENINTETALYMTISEYDDPIDYINRDIMVQRYLEPNREKIKDLILQNTQNHLTQNVVSNWENIKGYYAQDYRTETTHPNLISEEIGEDLSYRYIRQVRMAEDTIKKYYQNWDNPAAASTMAYLRKNK